MKMFSVASTWLVELVAYLRVNNSFAMFILF